MPTPGLIFVGSRALDSAKTPDELFNRWHNDEHVPGVLATGQTRLGLRYKNADPSSALPYLALYPVEDSAAAAPENAKLLLAGGPRQSRLLSCDDTRDLVSFDVRALEKTQTYEAAPGRSSSSSGGGDDDRPKTLLCVGLEPRDGGDDDLDAWFREEHLDFLAASPSYRRCTRYVLRSSGAGGPPRFLALHEYDCETKDLPTDRLAVSCETDWAKRVLGPAKALEREVFELVGVQGDMGLKL
ncbi:hypothetical protein F5X96DRAFT_44704 [Biscogniauxia mediterranea]|nr:hypothetical protein F5X96DRAFT_44704 [Biscogniauxia mediterranea]